MPHGASHMSSEMQTCIDACQDCHAVCLETVQHCLGKGGEHAAREHIRTLLECAEICRTSADFMLMEAGSHAKVCGICAEICVRCAQECERFGDDEMMKACAEACRRCAESCRKMAGMAVAA